MWRMLTRVLNRIAKIGRHQPSKRRPRPSVRPQFEALETRLVPAGFNDAVLINPIEIEPIPVGPSYAALPVTDYSALARQFPRHAGPSTLYLNFDGWQAQAVSPYQSVMSSRRDRDIQEILFRSAEVFSPFDVQVKRIAGDGARGSGNGDSTLFIGDIAQTNGANQARAFTPALQADQPGDTLGYDHRPNSNASDFAFVDPIFLNPTGALSTRLVPWISQAIAHEAGHTFGLAHVLSNPTPDVMSYDAGNSFFADATFNITDLNFNPATNANEPLDAVVPKWGPAPTRMRTQNSYTFLSAVLGSAPGDDYANVVHAGSVQYMIGAMPNLAIGSDLTASIERAGDYDVFQFMPSATQSLMVSAQRVAGTSVDPVLLIFQGDNIVDFNDNRTTSDFSSRVTMSFTAGATFRIVVGAASGGSAGAYRLWLNVPTAANPDTTAPRVTSATAKYDADYNLTHFVVTFSKDIDPSTFTWSDVQIISPTGVIHRPTRVVEVAGSYHRKFEVHLGGLRPGVHTLRIGPDVRDFAGNWMSTFYTKSFTIEPLDRDYSATRPGGAGGPL